MFPFTEHSVTAFCKGHEGIFLSMKKELLTQLRKWKDTSLVVYAPNAEGLGSVPGQGT